MKNKNIGHNIHWVEYWIETVDPKSKQTIIARKTEEGKWKCRIWLPLLKSTIEMEKDTQLDATLAACDLAAELIDEYMNDHPEIQVTNKFKDQKMETLIDEEGHILWTSPYDEKYDMKLIKQRLVNSGDALTKAFGELALINIGHQLPIIHLYDLSEFDEFLEDDYFFGLAVSNKLHQEDPDIIGTNYIVYNNKVLGIGYYE